MSLNRRLRTAIQSGILLVALGTVIMILGPRVVIGAPLQNVPVEVVQPDGEILYLFATGDEFYNWVHDENGFTVVRHPDTGYVEYAILQDGQLVGSGYRVGTVDPASVGLAPNVNLPPERMLEERQMPAMGPEAPPELSSPAPTSGTINNLVIFIRFSGESEFTDATSIYNSMFNSPTPGANSMYNYFREVSYNALTISTTCYPIPPGSTVVSYQDGFTRPYYQPYNLVTNPIGYQTSTESRYRLHTLLQNATNAVSYQIPAPLNIDGDSDGDVDNVCYIVSGSQDTWTDLLWPHQWELYTNPIYGDPINCWTYINGKQVWTYNFQLQTSLASSGVGVLCHEMFHSLGAPDLYHYPPPDPLHPVGTWDLMEYCSNPPQHMSAYMKYEYGGWIGSIPEISSRGTYALNPLTSATGQCYKIASNNSPTEYFVIEYRRDTGTFESSLPGSGLLVYRINTSVPVADGNKNGPPDRVYLYRPGGTTSVDGNWSTANFSSTVGRTAINDLTTDPTSFLTDGSAGGLSIWDVGAYNGTISFKVAIAPPPTAAVFRVESGGDVLMDQTLYSAALASGLADVAEWVEVSEPVEPGDVLEFDPSNPGQYRKARGPCSPLIAGVVSSEPGVVLGSGVIDFPVSSSTSNVARRTSHSALMALIGIVPVKACDEGGPIEPGDLLVTASRSGYVMRSNSEDCAAIVGKALQPLAGHEGLILVLLTR